MDDCLFCRIATRQQPADVIHEDDDVVAFRDIDPQAPTHILLIPKEHLDSARALKDRHADVLAQLFQVAAHLARAEGIDRAGWRVVTNVGPGAGQTVRHLHFHLLGGRDLGWPPG
jgi:histidine triad (HIT) family protein